MNRVARMLGLWATVLATSCGSSSPGGGGLTTAETGTVTFSGAATGTLSVSILAGFEAPSTYVGFVISSAPGSYPNFNFTGRLPGTSLQAAAYTDADATLPGVNTIYSSTSAVGASWEQVYSTDPALPETGTFSFTITSPGPSVSASGVTDWFSPHGSLTATLVPISAGASGTVNATITF